MCDLAPHPSPPLVHRLPSHSLCLQASYSQHTWWEVRDCTQAGQCIQAPDDQGVMHPGGWG